MPATITVVNGETVIQVGENTAEARRSAQRAQFGSPFPSRADLLAAPGAQVGDRAAVSLADTGTHISPQDGSTQLNTGIYIFDATHGWLRYDALDGQFSRDAKVAAEAARDDAVLAKLAAEAARDTAIAAPDSAVGNRLDEEMGTRNLFLPENMRAGYVNGVTGAFTASGSFTTTGPIRVSASTQYIVRHFTAGSGSAGVVYYNSSMVRVGGSNSLASNLFTTPANCAFMEVTFDGGTTGWQAREQEVYRGSSIPSTYSQGRPQNRVSAATQATKQALALSPAKRDFIVLEEFINGGFINTTNGGTTANSSYACTNLIPGHPGAVRIANWNESGNVGIALYDIDGNWLRTINAGGTAATTSGSNIVTISTEGVQGDLILPIGTRFDHPNVPANTYITGGPDRGLGDYTLSANATATGSGSYTARGVVAGAPFTFPRNVYFARFPVLLNGRYCAQIVNSTPLPGDTYRGRRHEYQPGMPIAGDDVILAGDSIMQSSAAGTGQPSAIPPGLSSTVGVTQYLIHLLTQARLQQARGNSGAKTREILGVQAGYAALSAADVATAVVTASTTSGSNSINVTAVTSGALAVGRRITGPNIPDGTVITALGTGTGGTGTYTISQNATGTGSVTITLPALRRFIEQSGTNSWGLATSNGNDAQAQVALGTLGDTWVPSQFTISATSGSKAITITGTALGAAANGMPVVHPGGSLGVGNSLVDLGGGNWELANPAVSTGTVTAIGGTFYGDLYDIYIRKLLAWEPKIQPVLFGLIRRFDGTAHTSNAAGPTYREGDPRNNQGVYLSQFNEAKRLFAERWGFRFFDCFNEVPFNSLHYSTYYTDLLHPNTRGVVEIYGQYLARCLNSLPRAGAFT